MIVFVIVVASSAVNDPTDPPLLFSLFFFGAIQTPPFQYIKGGWLEQRKRVNAIKNEPFFAFDCIYIEMLCVSLCIHIHSRRGGGRHLVVFSPPGISH